MSHSKRGLRRAALSIAVAAALVNLSVPAAHAAGLGRLTVLSALGQPLRAEVEVTAVGRDEAASLSAKLASAEAFRQAGLEFNPVLGNLRFAVEKRGERTFIKITSNQVVNEPFVDLMVELNWATGRFVREYTFLLDPPELRAAQQEPVRGSDSSFVPPQVAASPAPVQQVQPAPAPAQPAPSVPQAQTPTQGSGISDAQRNAAREQVEQRQAANAPRTSRPAPTPAVTPAPAASTAPSAAPADGSGYTVKRGDTLAGIAGRNNPGVALEQAVVAIYRANPSAFFGDVNRMRAGAVLTIPDQAAMGAVNLAEAQQQVRLRAGSYAGVKNRLAAKPKRLSVARDSQGSSGKVAGVVEEAGASKSTRDQLKLSKPSTVASASGVPSSTGSSASGNAPKANSKAEQSVANQAALKEANSRVNDLEKNVANMQKLLELKDKSLADATKKVEAAKPNAAAKSGVDKLDPINPSAAAKDQAKDAKPLAPISLPPLAGAPDSSKAQAPAKAAEIKLPELKAPEAKAPEAKAVDPVALPPLSATPTAPTSPAVTSPVNTEPPKADATVPPVAPSVPPAATAPKAPAKPRIAPEPIPEPSLMDTVMDNIAPIGGGLGGLALLGGGAYWWMRRKKKAQTDSFDDSLVAAEAISPNSLFGTTGGQNVDTSQENNMFGANADGASGQSAISASTEVDPIAEAEVYIAYGRESQAEDILREALKRQPERHPIRLKLAEIYSSRKDTGALESIAKEMFDATGGQGDDWPRMATLGMSIDPNNPLYTGESGAVASAPVIDAPAPSAPKPQALGRGNNDGGTIANAMGLAGGLGALGAGVAASAASLGSSAKPSSTGNQAAFASDSLGSEGLDFDLDIDSSIGKSAVASPVAKPAAVAPAAPVASFASASAPKIDLDFGLPALSDPKPIDEVVALDLNQDMDFKLDLPALEGLSITGKQRGAATGASALMDSAANLVDLSSINLDLPGAGVAVAEPALDLGADTEVRGRWQEMATKLDLASAYEEIGDKEGARELLDEVIKGGDGSQQQRAKAMLSKLG